MILLLGIFVHPLIQQQYQELVKKAIESSKHKIPKEHRQSSKYPGVYESTNYKLRLLTTLTNAQTHDIKGFSYNDHNCAIIKRKTFNLTGGYAIVEPKTQEIFLMNSIVAKDGNIIVYNSTKVNIFSIMTEFVLEGSTDSQAIDLNSIRIRKPKASFSLPFHWDSDRDRPTLKEIHESGISAGVGCAFTFGVHTRCLFNNIWDVSIVFQFVFEGKFGAELLMPDECEIEIESQTLYSLKQPINGLGFSSKFLGLQISLGAFINFVVEFTDMKIVIPVGFDYFKGYSLTATKYFEITPTSISDSKWQLSFSSLPEGDSINNIIKNLLNATFTATFQLRPYLSLEFIIGDIEVALEAGIKFPVVFVFSLNRAKCNFPYLYGEVSMPIRMYFSFSGLEVNDYEIIKSAEKEIMLREIKLTPFCVGKSRTYSNPESERTHSYLVKNDEIYESKESSTRYKKQLIISRAPNFKNYEFVLKYPLVEYNDINNKQKEERLYFSIQPSQSDEIKWSIKYYNDKGDLSNSTNDYLAKISDLKFVDDQVTLSPVVSIGSDKTCMNSLIKRAQHIQTGVPFAPESKIFMATFSASIGTKYALYYTDEKNNFIQDKEVVFSLASMLCFSYSSKEMFTIESKTQRFHLQSLVSKSDEKCKLIIDFYMKYEQNDQGKIVKITTFCTQMFSKGSYMNVPFMIYPWWSEFDFREEQSLFYSGKIIYENNEEKEVTETYFNLTNMYVENSKNPILSIQVDENVNISFMFNSIDYKLIIESTRKDNLPPVMILLESTEITEQIEPENDFTFRYRMQFGYADRYKLHRLSVPDIYKNHKLLLMNVDFFNRQEISLFGKNLVQLNNDQSYVELGDEDTFEFVAVRSSTNWPSILFRFIFCEFNNETLFLSPQGTPIQFGYDVPTLIFIPIYFDNYHCIMNNTNEEYYWHTIYPCFGDSADEYVVETFHSTTMKPQVMKLQLAVYPMGDLEPYLNVDLSPYQDFYDQIGNLSFNVVSANATKIKCEFNGKTQVFIRDSEDDNNFKFLFEKKNDPILATANFTSVCSDDVYGVACEITYPAPKRSGFHLIEYPNRDGISITGRGFFRELIPVDAGKEFVYYKTYSQPIKLIREYYNDERSSFLSSLKIKIDDNRKSKIDGFLRTRTICLLDDNNEILPFSRKFIENDMNSFLKAIGVSENVDYNKFFNDQNGCIVFDPKFIESNDLNNISKRVCDLYSSDDKGLITDIDKSNILFEAGGKDPQQQKKMIIIIVVVVVIVVVVIAIIITVCVIRKKKKNTKYNDSSVEDENSPTKI